MLEFDKKLCDRIFFSLPGLSDSQIGEMVGVKRQTVQGWRNGKSRPTLIQVNKISQETSISIRWFTTGRTTDPYSLSYAYYPIFYKTNEIQNPKAYVLAREVCLELLNTSNDRIFLPILSLLNDIAFNVTTNNSYCTLINGVTSLEDVIETFEPFTKKKVSQATLNTFKLINESYISSESPININSNKTYSETQAIANTSFKNIKTIDKNFYEILTFRNNFTLKIYGVDLSPTINDKSLITISNPIKLSSISKYKPTLLVIELPKGYKTPYNHILSNSTLLCRYGYNDGNHIILTGLSHKSVPYIISYNNIVNVFKVNSVIFNSGNGN